MREFLRYLGAAGLIFIGFMCFWGIVFDAIDRHEQLRMEEMV